VPLHAVARAHGTLLRRRTDAKAKLCRRHTDAHEELAPGPEARLSGTRILRGTRAPTCNASTRNAEARPNARGARPRTLPPALGHELASNPPPSLSSLPSSPRPLSPTLLPVSPVEAAATGPRVYDLRGRQRGPAHHAPVDAAACCHIRHTLCHVRHTSVRKVQGVGFTG